MEKNNYDESYYYKEYEGSYESDGYEWTEEDSWDVLTEGMYGEMPSNPMEYDAIMDSLGF